MANDPFKQHDVPDFKFDTFDAALKDGLKQPYIGVTQGGSSRSRGARVAATSTANPQTQPKENS
jgi:hypothetical protein